MSNESNQIKHINALLTQVECHNYLVESHTPWEAGFDVTNTPFEKSCLAGNESAKEVNMFLIQMTLGEK